MEQGCKHVLETNTVLKALNTKLQNLECILTGTFEGFELSNNIIKYEFSKYHSDGSIDLVKRESKKFIKKNYFRT